MIEVRFVSGLVGPLQLLFDQSLGEPILNSPGGMSTSFIPIELVISTGTPRCLAHAS